MEHDEHEMLIEYSEMTAFNFDSKEFREVAKDFAKCRDVVSNFSWNLREFFKNFKSAKAY